MEPEEWFFLVLAYRVRPAATDADKRQMWATFATSAIDAPAGARRGDNPLYGQTPKPDKVELYPPDAEESGLIVVVTNGAQRDREWLLRIRDEFAPFAEVTGVQRVENREAILDLERNWKTPAAVSEGPVDLSQKETKAVSEGPVDLSQKETKAFFLVTVYKVKDSVGIQGMRELAIASEQLRKDSAQIAPRAEEFQQYTTDDGTSGVIIIESDQPDSAWVNQVKRGLATWIEFGETQRMETFRLANFKFGIGAGPRDRRR